MIMKLINNKLNYNFWVCWIAILHKRSYPRPGSCCPFRVTNYFVTASLNRSGRFVTAARRVWKDLMLAMWNISPTVNLSFLYSSSACSWARTPFWAIPPFKTTVKKCIYHKMYSWKPYYLIFASTTVLSSASARYALKLLLLWQIVLKTVSTRYN